MSLLMKFYGCCSESDIQLWTTLTWYSVSFIDRLFIYDAIEHCIVSHYGHLVAVSIIIWFIPSILVP